MTEQEKKLLLKDLCARLPYGVICTDNRHGDSRIFNIDVEDESVYYTDFDEYGSIENCKPYLRPMSSMTEEEKVKYQQLKNQLVCQVNTIKNGNLWKQTYVVDLDEDSIYIVDWLNAHHFDYRGLIEKGLALPAPENMYN